MAALLTSEIDDGNKRDILVEHIDDARRMGVEVLPPSVNHSEGDFTVEKDKIVFGLTAVKGCGRNAAEEIARARKEGGPFKDLFDLCERIDHRVVPKAALEKLIKAGALDCLGGHRAQLLHALGRAMQAAADRQHDQRIGQRSLFDDFSESASSNGTAEQLPDVAPWSETEKLKQEKEVLDFYFSNHPLAQHEKELRRFSTHTAADVKTLPAQQDVVLGGMLSHVRFRNTKRARNGNSRFAAFKIEDITGAVECVMWPDDLARCKEPIKDDCVCYVQGIVERNREEPTLVLSRVINREQIAKERATGLWLLLQLGKHRPVEIDALGEILRKSPGPTPVFLTIKDPANRTSVLRLGRHFSVNASTFDFDGLERLLGAGSVRLE
jgi:DNA polymerase-3 subunit alpha